MVESTAINTEQVHRDKFQSLRDAYEARLSSLLEQVRKLTPNGGDTEARLTVLFLSIAGSESY